MWATSSGSVLCRDVRIDHQHEHVSTGARDRREILHRIVGERLEQMGIGRMRRVGRHQQRVAVGRGARDVSGGDTPLRRLVLDDDAPIERDRELLCDDTGDRVCAAAGGERHHDGDRLCRISLCACARGEQRQRAGVKKPDSAVH